MVTGVQGEIRYRPGNVTGGSEEMRNGFDIVTAVQEEIPYCSSGISSRKQKKARSMSQPQFCSENTPATFEAGQILLALQQLATNSISANINNTSNRISKLPKSLTTTMPTFDGKSDEFELFEDLFQTSFKIHNQLTGGDKVNYFHSLMRGDALQTFKNIRSPRRENVGEFLTAFLREFLKPQSMAVAKLKIYWVVFNEPEVNWFSGRTSEASKDAFGVAVQRTMEQFRFAKRHPQLKISINQAHLENGTSEQIVSRVGKDLELNGWEASDELRIITMTQNATEPNPEKLKPTCHQCKKPGHYRNQCPHIKRGKGQAQNKTNSAGNYNKNKKC